MKSRAALLIALALLAILAAWHWREMRRLNAENAALRAQAAAAQLVTATRETAAADRDQEELRRLRAEHLELLKLRGEVGALRQQIRNTASTRPAAGAAATAATEPGASESAASAVTRHVSNFNISLGPDQVLLTGGWSTSSTGRTFVVMAPKRITDEQGNASIQTEGRIFSVPESALARLGLESYRANSPQGGGQWVLTGQACGNLMVALEHEPGADLLAAPKILTANGRQAQIKVGQQQPLPNGELVEIGPVLDITPTLKPDGSGIELIGTASFSQLGKP